MMATDRGGPWHRRWKRRLITIPGVIVLWIVITALSPIIALATLGWVWSVAGGWIAVPIVYPLTALQVWVLGRRAGRVHPITAALFPLLVIVFAAVFLRSLHAVAFRRDVTWKGRRVGTRAG